MQTLLTWMYSREKEHYQQQRSDAALWNAIECHRIGAWDVSNSNSNIYKASKLLSFKCQTGLSAKEERRQKLLKCRSSQWAVQFGEACYWDFGRQHVKGCLQNEVGNFLPVTSTLGKDLFSSRYTHTCTHHGLFCGRSAEQGRQLRVLLWGEKDPLHSTGLITSGVIHIWKKLFGFDPACS